MSLLREEQILSYFTQYPGIGKVLLALHENVIILGIIEWGSFTDIYMYIYLYTWVRIPFSLGLHANQDETYCGKTKSWKCVASEFLFFLWQFLTSITEFCNMYRENVTHDILNLFILCANALLSNTLQTFSKKINRETDSWRFKSRSSEVWSISIQMPRCWFALSDNTCPAYDFWHK